MTTRPVTHPARTRRARVTKPGPRAGILLRARDTFFTAPSRATLFVVPQMRIVYCTDTYPPQVNGVSVVTALSVEGMRARGWDCHVIAPRYRAERPRVFETDIAGQGPETDPRLTVLPSTPMPGYRDVRLSLPNYGLVKRAIATAKPDLVHVETEFIVGRMAQTAATRLGIPLVTSYHTDFTKYMTAYGVPWLSGTVSNYLARFHKRALRTYTPSMPSRRELWRLGVPDVEVWGRGVDTGRFRPELRSMTLRNELGLGGAFTFLYVGRLAAEKAVGVVIEAFRQVEARCPRGSVRLVIAGEGPDQQALRFQAPGSTVFLGYLDRTHDLPTLYASADAFVFASTTETLGLVVLEAMSSGLPVVASPEGGVADHLRNGENGLSCPARSVEAFTQAMMRLVTEHELAGRLRAGARRTAEGLTWDHELDRLDVSYREVCSETVAWKAFVPLELQRSP